MADFGLERAWQMEVLGFSGDGNGIRRYGSRWSGEETCRIGVWTVGSAGFGKRLMGSAMELLYWGESTHRIVWEGEHVEGADRLALGHTSKEEE